MGVCVDQPSGKRSSASHSPQDVLVLLARATEGVQTLRLLRQATDEVGRHAQPASPKDFGDTDGEWSEARGDEEVGSWQPAMPLVKKFMSCDN